MKVLIATILMISSVLRAQTVEIDNEQVIVRRRIWAPLEVFMKTEPLRSAVLVFVSGYHVRFTYLAREPDEKKGKSGDAYWHAGGISGLDNLTDRPAVMLRVQPNCNSGLSTAKTLASLPDEFENDCVTVRRTRRAPGERTEFQSHPSTVVVAITDMKLKVTYSDGRTREIAHKRGQVFWDPGGVYRTENRSGKRVEELRIVRKK